ncbi:MAG TPA: hypothetical protein VGR24_01935 [bacterium]|jgi:hypothetical protein|nr:hypothetical protein [bacterium]
MLLFRSEDHVDRWCVDRNLPRGAVLTIDQGWKLARAWYSDRLDPDSRGRTAKEIEVIFADLRLTGPYWEAARP